MSDLFYPGLTTVGPGRYLNQADFPSINQDRNFGGVTNQIPFTDNSSGGGQGVDLRRLTNGPDQAPISDGGLPLRLTTNFGNTQVSAFGNAIVVDDHIGNYSYCGMYTGTDAGVFNGINQQFGWTRDPTPNSTFLFGPDAAWDDGWSIAYWVRLRNNATSQNSPGEPFAWGGTVTDNNGSAGDNDFSIYGARGHGNRLVYRHRTGSTNAGQLVFRRSFTASEDVVLTNQPPQGAEWVHIAVRRPANTSNPDVATYRIWVNGVGEDITALGGFQTGGGNIRVGYNRGGGGTNFPMSLTCDTSEVWLTSVGGYSGTLWDDTQVLKMYGIGNGTFVIPNFTNQTKANSASYGTFTWEAPMAVTTINFTGAASGGGGGTSPTANNVSTNNASGGGGGGGGAAWLFEEGITVIPGQTYTFVVADGGAATTDGSDLTVSGQINGSSNVTVTINGGKLGNNGSIGTNAASGGSAGAGGASSTTGGEITTSGAAGGGGGASQNSLPVSSPGLAGGDTTVNGSTISGGSGGAGGAPRRRGGGGGGGASILGGGNGGPGSNAAAAGAGGGGGGGAGFLMGSVGGTGSAGTGGAGGFTFNYQLPKDSTDNALVGP